MTPINSGAEVPRPPRGMTFCPDCGGLVSKKAYSCPKCGRVVNPLGLTVLKVILWLAAATLAIGVILWIVAVRMR
jgi:hypothetical protein